MVCGSMQSVAHLDLGYYSILGCTGRPCTIHGPCYTDE